MRAVLASLLLAASTPALAGGVGVLTTGGFRNQPVYFYDSSDSMRQYKISETLGHGGGGIEILLGDRDDRFIGTFKGYYIYESPERDPAGITSAVDPGNVVAAWRTEGRHIGVASVGLQAGIIGKPRTKQLVAVADLGSGFLTTDHTEYLQAQIGLGGTAMLSREIQVYAQAQYHLRNYKGLYHGATATAGIRYMFD